MTAPPAEPPNVFKLYEENIGPLTPLIADALKDAEEIYSAGWIAEAIDLAAKNNKRSWKYAEAILKRWKEEGRAEKQNRRDHQGSRQRDVEDKIKKFVGG
jgi:DnaD/phage-associated family protein